MPHSIPAFVLLIDGAILQVVICLAFLSVFSLALERYFAIARPLWHKIHITPRVCVFWIAAVWFCGTAFASICAWLLLQSKYTHRELLLQVYSTTIFLATIQVYLAAYFAIRTRRLGIANDDVISETVRTTLETRLKNERCFLSTIFIVNCFLLTTILPWLITFFLIERFAKAKTSCLRNLIDYVLYHVVSFLFALNFVVNPFIYLWRLPKYRKTFLVLYCKCLH